MFSSSLHRSAKISTVAYLALAFSFAMGGVSAYLANRLAASWDAAAERSIVPLPKVKMCALGRLQPKGGLIAVYGPPGDRVQKLRVKLGDRVQADAPLAQLASRKDREMDRDLVATQLREAREQRVAIDKAGQAKIAAADAEIAQLRGGRVSDLKAQDARIAVLEIQVKNARDQNNRLKSLQRTSLSSQELEKSALLVRQAEGELTAARAIRTKTETGYDRGEDTAQAKRRAAVAELEEAVKRVPVDSLEENLKLAQRRLDATEIKAPIAGRVLKIIGHEGEATGAQPILQLANTEEMVAVAEVYETDMGDLNAWLAQSGVEVLISSRAFPDGPLKGEIRPNSISFLIEKNQLFSPNPREDIDRRVIQVRVTVQPDSVKQASRYVGLEVDVQFQPKNKP